VSMLKCCLNWKVLVGLGVVAAGVWLFQPSAFRAALPTLAVLICPLSMGLMMFGMGKMGGMNDAATQGTQPGQQYTCPMHPEVRQDQPGRCPKCGMNLVPVAQPKPTRAIPASADGAPLNREQQLAQLRTQLRQVGEQQAALERQMGELGAEDEALPTSNVLREAEQVARDSVRAARGARNGR